MIVYILSHQILDDLLYSNRLQNSMLFPGLISHSIGNKTKEAREWKPSYFLIFSSG